MSRGLAIEATYTDDNYTFTYLGGEIEMSRLRSKPDTINAEIAVRWTIPPYDGLLHGPANTNLLADRTLKATADHCQRQLDQGPDDFPWWKFLNQAKSMAIRRFRAGDPLQTLHDADFKERPRFLIPELVEWDGATVMAAPGGSVKSFVALAAAAAVATGRSGFLGGIDPSHKGPVVYLDWESNRFTHAERLAALCAPLREAVPRDVLYRREYLSLAQTAPDLARMVAKAGAVMVIVDSKGAASATGGERDGTIDFYNAVRRLGVGALIVDHVNKAAAYGKETLTAYGSIYTENLARRLWVAPRAVPTQEGVAVLWKLIKVNNGRSGRQLGFHVKFASKGDVLSAVEVKQIAPGDPLLEPPIEGITLAERLLSVMQLGDSYSKAELSALLDESADSVKRTLSRLKAVGRVHTTGSGPSARWYQVPSQSADQSEQSPPSA